MVSPQKKKKLDTNKGGAKAGLKKHISKTPLAGKIFFLDIQNHATSKNVESRLVALGAKVSVFLEREVTHVVTDRENFVASRRTSLSNPSPSPSPSPSPFRSISSGTIDSPTDGVNPFRARSRAETMLNRVKYQPQTVADILDNAIAWKIPIHYYQKFILWIVKVEKEVEKLKKNNDSSLGRGKRELTGLYLKIETTLRPEFKEFTSWPSIAGDKRDQANRNESQRMTKKVKITKESTSTRGGGHGYCEMCHCHYDKLDSHVACEQHLKIVSNASNYSHLDSIINQHNLGVGTIRKSLRIAKSPPPVISDMGSRHSTENQKPSSPINSPQTPKVNGHVTRSSSRSTPRVPLGSPVPLTPNCNGIDRRPRRTPLKENETKKIKFSSPSPTPKNTPTPSTEHNLRSRRSQPSESPPPKTPKAMPSLRATPVVPKAVARTSKKLPGKSLPPPSSQTKKLIKKRLSVEEKLLEDNKSYYKVEVLNNKLRSTGYFISQNKPDDKVNGNTSAENSRIKSPNGLKSGVVVRFKKVRKSELAILSDEAESFMFGEAKKETENDETMSEDSSNIDEYNEDSEDSDDETTESEEYKTNKKIKKGSKSSEKSQDEDVSIKEEQPDLSRVKIENEESFKDLKNEDKNVEFSFEMKPRKDVWMKTYERQLTDTEHYIPQYHEYPREVLLPYEIPPPSSRDPKRIGQTRVQQLQSEVFDDKPRKSPRCHASTLAIMSSIIPKRRSLRECTTEKPINYDEESSLTETVESSASAASAVSASSAPRCPPPDLLVAACSRIDDVYSDSFLAKEKKGEIHPATFLGVDHRSLDEAIPLNPSIGFDCSTTYLFETLPEALPLEEHCPPHLRFNLRINNDSCASSECSDFYGIADDAKLLNKKRKRKRNMTGWPNESKYKRRIKEMPMTEPFITFSPHVMSPLPTMPRKRGRPPKNPQLHRYRQIYQTSPLRPSLLHLTSSVNEKSEEDSALSKQSEDELLSLKKSEDELPSKKNKSDDELSPRKKCDDELSPRKKSDEEISPRKKSDDEISPRKKSEDEISPRKKSEDEPRKKKLKLFQNRLK